MGFIHFFYLRLPNFTLEIIREKEEHKWREFVYSSLDIKRKKEIKRILWIFEFMTFENNKEKCISPLVRRGYEGVFGNA